VQDCFHKDQRGPNDTPGGKMSLWERMKQGVRSVAATAQMDDYLIEQIDHMLSQRWEKTSEKRPTNIGGVSLEKEAQYTFSYRHQGREIKVELEHEFPNLEIEVNCGPAKHETKVPVNEFVEKEGTEFSLKNEARLRQIVDEIASMAE
jgi:hypothetical protein